LRYASRIDVVDSGALACVVFVRGMESREIASEEASDDMEAVSSRMRSAHNGSGAIETRIGAGAARSSTMGALLTLGVAVLH